ncbi:hypothetical protein SDC9_73358 [bioreactor metagenome]|uniref:Uncharacterized protein n=1 Tax=bioreactor metagenome TaxID=1076179 RepID=A0A644YK20_9ZZZZ
MHPADPLVLGDRALLGGIGRHLGTEGQELDVTCGGAQAHDDPPQPVVPLPAGQHRGEPVGGIGQVDRLGPPDVQLDGRVLARLPPRQPVGDQGRQRTAGGEFAGVTEGGDEPGRAPLEGAARGDHRASVDRGGDHVGELVVGVVAADDHLEDRLVGRDLLRQPLGQEGRGVLGQRRQGGDPLRVVRRVRVGRQGLHLGPGVGQDGGALGIHLGLVEPAEPDRTGQVADRREPALGGPDEPLELGAGGPGVLRLRGGLGDPPVQDRQDHLHVAGHPLLGGEDPRDGVLQRRGAVEGVHTVVAERPGEPLGELRRHPGAVDVEALQVAVELLAVGVDPQLGAGLLAERPVAAQLGQVGEQRDQRDLAGQHVGTSGPGRVAGGEVAVDGVRGGVDVVAEQPRGQVGAQGVGNGCRAGAGLGGRQLDGAGGGGDRGGLALLVLDRLEADQRRHRLDLAAGHHLQLLDPRGERRGHDSLHLHRLEDDHRGTGLDHVADGDRGRDDERGGGRAEHAALVAAHPVGDAVDLDQVHRAVGGGHQPVLLAVDGDPAVDVVEPQQVGVDGDLTDPYAVVAGPGLPGGDGVHDAAQLEVDGASRHRAQLRPSTAGGLQQPGQVDGVLLVVRLDRRGDQRDAGVPVGDQAALGAGAVDPAGVGPADRRAVLEGTADHLGPFEQLQDETLVGGAALDHHGGLGQRATEPTERLLAGAAMGDDLGDHRVEVGRDGVALGDTGVDPDAGTGGQVEAGDPAGRGGEVTVGVLGVQPGLDRVAELGGTFGEAAAVGDVDLCLHQVVLVGDLGDRVLDLEAGVDLEEGELLLLRLVEELHGAGAAVVDRQGEPLGGRLEVSGLLVGEQRGGGLLDHLLVAPLDGAVAHTDRPGRSPAVGDHLDLDMAGAGDELLEEDDTGAEGALGLVAGALVGVGQVTGRPDLADAAAATTGGRLEHQRVADPVRRSQGLLEGVHTAPGPRRDRDADLLGEELAADLVAELAHRVTARADEGDAEALDEIGEGGVLGDEAPADPDRVGAGRGQRPGQQLVVEVRTPARRADRVGLVRLTGEHRRTFGVRVQRDRGDGRLAPPPFRVQIADGVDEPHGGLATIDDSDALDHRYLLVRGGQAPPLSVLRLAPRRRDLPTGTSASTTIRADPMGRIQNRPRSFVGTPHRPCATRRARPFPAGGSQPTTTSSTVTSSCSV